MARAIDLSHPLEQAMPREADRQPPQLSPVVSFEQSHVRYAPGVEFQTTRFSFDTDLGTHLDAPRHRYASGPDVAGLPLERLANLPGVLLNASRQREREIGIEQLIDLELRGRAVLIRTDWSTRWSIPSYWHNWPYLTAGAANYLAMQGVALVGIDCGNVDDESDISRPAHSTLLAAGIPLVEHLTNLAALANDFFRFFAVPLAVKGADCFPVRAFALIDS